MNINTKHSIGEPIWFIHNSKAVEAKIVKIDIEVKDDSEPVIKFWVNLAPDGKYDYHIVKFAEAFKSREELIQSL